MNRKKLTFIVFVATFLTVFTIVSSLSALTPEQLTLVGIDEKGADFFIGYQVAYDGKYLYSLYPFNSSTVVVWKYDFNGNIIDSYDTGIPSSDIDFYNSPIETDGTNLYLILYNFTSLEYTLIKFNLGVGDIEYQVVLETGNITGDLFGLEYVEGSLYVLSISYIFGSESLLKETSANISIYKIDENTGLLIKQNIDTSIASKNYSIEGYLTYIGDDFLIGLSPAALATPSGVLIRNITTDLPNLDIPQDAEILSDDIFISAIDSSPDNKELIVVVSRYAHYNVSGNIDFIQDSYIVKYSYSTGGATTTPTFTSEPDVTEPVTATSVTIATVSAVAAAGTVSTATAVGTAGAATTSAAGAASAGSAGTSAAGGTGGAGASAMGTGTAGAELTFKSTGLEGKIDKYGLRIGKYALKLFRRRKKRGEEERFEKPSFIKLMLSLAIISGLLTVVFFAFNPSILSNLLLAGSTLVTGIGFAFGVFGLLTGYLLFRALKAGLLPPATLLGKLSLGASIIGGIYGLVTSAMKLLGAFGILSVIAWLLLFVVGFAFAYAAYISTLRIYGRL